jgi:hypothetical protein
MKLRRLAVNQVELTPMLKQQPTAVIQPHGIQPEVRRFTHVVRLPDGLRSGDLPLTVTLSGHVSNLAILTISP